MAERSKLVRMRITNIGCVGTEGLEVALDNVLCIVGPNNTGKSTVLRAYELAVGSQTFKENDYNLRGSGEPASVELWVHIPEGMANIAEIWKEIDGNLRLVRSKWEWCKSTEWKKIRQTWDPEKEVYAPDGKASGLDTVFNKRLPEPLRIGTLDDPEQEHTRLLKLILQPISDRLKVCLDDTNSELCKALNTFNELAKAPIAEEAAILDSLKQNLNRSHKQIFPDLEIDFEISMGSFDIDPLDRLSKNSQVTFREWATDIDWKQQGTGAQRALFWTMMQVRSGMQALANAADNQTKTISAKEKEITKLQNEADKAKKEDTKKKKLETIQEVQESLAKLRDTSPEKILKEESSEFSLPGHVLLIDEPEVALHPGAIRAASRQLYGLGEDPAWQVMITTHSTAFIDPLQDHTTVVRLARTEANPTPRTYRADEVNFTEDEKTKLKMLNKFDQGLSEMFFGQHPLLVEGDTEFAVFEWIMNNNEDIFPYSSRPTIVRARGKSTLALLVRMLSHFKVPFSILHDTDNPKRMDGKNNGAWTVNSTIYSAIKEARKQDVRVVHRVSLPNFENHHLPVEVNEDEYIVDTPSKEKPWNMLEKVRASDEAIRSVMALLQDLLRDGSAQEPFEVSFDKILDAKLKMWAQKNAPKDKRYWFD